MYRIFSVASPPKTDAASIRTSATAINITDSVSVEEEQHARSHQDENIKEEADEQPSHSKDNCD